MVTGCYRHVYTWCQSVWSDKTCAVSISRRTLYFLVFYCNSFCSGMLFSSYCYCYESFRNVAISASGIRALVLCTCIDLTGWSEHCMEWTKLHALRRGSKKMLSAGVLTTAPPPCTPIAFLFLAQKHFANMWLFLHRATVWCYVTADWYVG